jgi:hypothetical protein
MEVSDSESLSIESLNARMVLLVYSFFVFADDPPRGCFRDVSDSTRYDLPPSPSPTRSTNRAAFAAAMRAAARAAALAAPGSPCVDKNAPLAFAAACSAAARVGQSQCRTPSTPPEWVVCITTASTSSRCAQAFAVAALLLKRWSGRDDVNKRGGLNVVVAFAVNSFLEEEVAAPYPALAKTKSFSRSARAKDLVSNGDVGETLCLFS